MPQKRIRVDIVRTKDIQVEVQKLAGVKAGDRLTILVPNGKRYDRETRSVVQEWKESTGRVVMPSSLPGAFVLNMGGRYGTPGIATEENTVAVKGRRV